MARIIRYLAVLSLLLNPVLTLATQSVDSDSAEAPEELSVDELVQLSHVKELMGKYFKKDVANKAYAIEEKNKFVKEWTEISLRGKWKKQAKKIANQILYSSKKFEMDPLFVMAVILGESSFNPLAKGGVGEQGLMQIRPTTARWVCEKEGITCRGKNFLFDPVMNIKIGVAYFYYLREEFKSHGRLYLAAYNMGATNVKRSLDKKKWPKEYPVRVMHHYLELYAELTKRGELKEMAATVLGKISSR
jgi:soluble lytic murein transglycosylase